MKKLVFAAIVVVALLIVAMPVAAQGPNPYVPVSVWFNRTPQINATWAGDPFGGNPKLNVPIMYVPNPGNTAVVAVLQSKKYVDYAGIVGKFGYEPYSPYNILPGGIPSSMSGDGSGPRKAIYIGGAWADDSVNPPNSTYGYWNLPTRGGDEHPYELPGCATVKIPAASSKWFKLDTWKTEPAGSGFNKVRTQIWVDDELDGATKPSGSAVFGAADKYFWGTAPNDPWQANVFDGYNAMDPNEINGYFMVVYDPDALQPNYAFAPPNAALFTLDVSGSGSLRRSCSAAAYAGLPCVPASKGGPSSNAGTSLAGMLGGMNKINGATFDPHHPSHLAWTEGGYDGWVFVRVFNQMIWDGTATVCSYRNWTGDKF